MKSVKMLNSRFENLDVILSSEQTSSNKYGLGFDSSVKNTNPRTKIKFVPASVNVKFDVPTATKAISPSAKSTR